MKDTLLYYLFIAIIAAIIGALITFSFNIIQGLSHASSAI